MFPVPHKMADFYGSITFHTLNPELYSTELQESKGLSPGLATISIQLWDVHSAFIEVQTLEGLLHNLYGHIL